MTKLFYCYSRNLRDKFISEGAECLGAGINPKTNKKYWLFLKTEKTGAILKEWEQNKN